MITLVDKVDVAEAAELMLKNGTRPSLVSKAISSFSAVGGECRLGIGPHKQFLLVKVGEDYGIAKRSKGDKYNFPRAFTIALLRALGLKD